MQRHVNENIGTDKGGEKVIMNAFLISFKFKTLC